MEDIKMAQAAPSVENPLVGSLSHEWKGEKKPHEEVYFESYAHIGIHEEMLKDSSRTIAYRNAVFGCAPFLKGKVVADIGCGTGVLSIFAAKAGARKVYAIDASTIARNARQIVKDNGLEGVIEVIEGRVEEIELPEKVDCIVSEWMGYFLVYESMLETVLTARDRWLNPGGIVLPAVAEMFLAPFTDPSTWEDKIDWWKNVYGINMSSMIPYSKRVALDEPAVDTMHKDNYIASPCMFQSIDCRTVTHADLEVFESAFSFVSTADTDLHGFGSWFDTIFEAPSAAGKAPSKVVLSTGPDRQYTHWKQTLFYLAEPIPVKTGSSIQGKIRVSKHHESRRFLNVELWVSVDGAEEITRKLELK